MLLRDFLNVIGGEFVKISEDNVFHVIYEADKNAIRLNKSELLDREIYKVHPVSKIRFEVLIK